MSLGKVLIALSVVFLGLYWLMDSLNIISPGIMSLFGECLPYLVILLGALLILSPIIKRKKPGFFWGLFFLIYGGLLLADKHGMLVFHWQDIWKLWPYIIIYFGLDMLFGKNLFVSLSGNFDHGKKKKKDKSHVEFIWNGDEAKEDSGQKDSYMFVNESSYKHENWMVKPMHERVRIADYNFDFTKAFIPEETIPITLSGWVGDIKITVPDDLAYRVDLRAKVGDAKIGKEKHSGILRNVSYQTGNYDEAVRKIDFAFDFQVIDLNIDQV
ncbi:cell wall-active antibiotics response protein LiaF [Sporolactobacillus pectinivorans]|uniref:cell wall-active antibiotics response protein LiaF n=1 Tax=Sporolactobacillus pectinivorans TaxID=1591408 RepID=UPI000C25D81E|nr:cell wall-active antibiotics response protein LiaF [Sporolactobacillus pectinivorans]